MATALWFKGAHLSPSPSGTLLASIINDCLRICFTATPERCIDFPTRIAPKDVLGLRWAPDSSSVLISTSLVIEIIDLEDDQGRARLQNGSAGFGRFSTADFLQADQVLTVWEFGRAKIWNLSNGQSVDIDNIKSVDGQAWAVRPANANTRTVLAYLSRPAADDQLMIHFPGAAAALAPIKLLTVDAKSILWSPDGCWLVVLDSPRHASNVHVFTADGHLYKTYTTASDTDESGLGFKSVTWSPDSQALALARHDGCIDIVSGRTLSRTAVIEHSLIIDQKDTTSEDQTSIWQECVSATSARSYKTLTMPVSPSQSRTKLTHEPRELGIADVSFSCDGKYLASRDERMLSTIWIWDVQKLRPQTVVIQHSNVRRVRWHTKRPDTLLIDCGENIVYVLDVASKDAPQHFVVPANGNATFSFSDSYDQLTILVATKISFSILRPEAQGENLKRDRTSAAALREIVDQEDSLFEILSGRAGVDLSYTERLELDIADNGTAQLDDTFSGRQVRKSHDPLDDSDIF